MKLILILVMWFLCTIQIIDSKRYRMQPDDQLYPYLADKSVPSVMDYSSMDHLIFEQIDDDNVQIGGYIVWKKSMNPRFPMQFSMQSQYFEKASWHEGPLRLGLPDMCTEFLNPQRFWYNLTKLFTNCPPQEGYKWFIEEQTSNFQIDLPPSFSTGPWRGLTLFTQDLFGGAVKFGITFQVELIEIY